MTRIRTIFILFLLLWTPLDAFSCSAFAMNHRGHFLAGANCDGQHEIPGTLYLNHKGIEKAGFVSSRNGRIAKWTSQFGSISVSFLGPELIQYGMNETGFVITTVGLPGSIPPTPDLRPPLVGNLWAQYLLDCCQSVEDALETLDSLRLDNSMDHYLIADSNGDVAVIECINGNVRVFRGESLPIQILTNAPYNRCLSIINNARPFVEDEYLSQRRFRNGYVRLESLSQEIPPEQAGFSVLDAMAQPPFTRWQLLFDITNRTLRFATSQNNKMQIIDLNQLDFSTHSPPEQASIYEKASFAPYEPHTSRANAIATADALELQMSPQTIHNLMLHIEAFYVESEKKESSNEQ